MIRKKMNKTVLVTILFVSVMLTVLALSCSKEDKQDMKTYKEVLLESPTRAKEMALRENLRLIRNAIEIFVANEGRYPESLDELADKSVLDHIPNEPLDGEYIYHPKTGKIKSTSRPQL